MKSYNERLPLIDAVIEELGGEFPPTAIGYSGRGYYAKGDIANILHKINFGDVCTRQEFEQRVKEREEMSERGCEQFPIGSKCRVRISDKMEDVEVLSYHGLGESKRAWVYSVNRGYRTVLPDSLRPLRTETDKLVEQAMNLFHETESTTDAKQGIEHAVYKLIEQGYRKIKPMSEQEFMKQCVGICGHGDARLYRAGCRFIEQVKV